MALEPPKFKVTEVAMIENGLCRVTMRLSDKTLAALTDGHPFGNQCSMSATVTLPAELIPLTVGQETGFTPTGAA